MAMSKWIPTTNLLQLRRLGKLSEELSEAGSVAARCIIQGLDEVDPGSGKVNRKRLQDELADVRAQIDCTVQAFRLDQPYMARRTAEKMRQMAEWEAMFAPAAPATGDLDGLLVEIDAAIDRWQGMHDTADDFSDEPDRDRAEFAALLRHLRAYRALLAPHAGGPDHG